MIKENFIDFLKTGTLKHFPFGTEELRVIKLLGEPDLRYDTGESSMITYDRTELYFYKGDRDSCRLHGVLIRRIPLANGYNLSMDYGWLNINLTYEKTKKLLAQEGIEFEETVSEADSNAKVIKTTGEVIFMFLQEDKKLDKVGRILSIQDFEQIEI